MGTLRDQMVNYMQTRGYSEKTIKLYTSCMKTFSLYFGRSPLDVSGSEIESFIRYLRGLKKSESTVHIYYAALVLFYSMYGQRARLPRLTFRRSSSRLPVLLSPEEVCDLLESCGNIKFRTIFTLIYSAGLRISEAAKLTLADIDFTRKTVFVRESKNGKDRYTILGDRTATMIKRYIEIYQPQGFLFYGTERSSGISTDSIQRVFRNLVSSHNGNRHIHVHTLRHCFATHLMEGGTSIFHIMHLLGHSNIQTTMLYLHMRSPESLSIRSPIDRLRFSEQNRSVPARGQLLLETA
jgi:integrase/recombinase XerD